MSDQEVVIRISAKNLTAAEFKKARQEILGLGEEVGETSKKTSGLGGGLRNFATTAGGVFRTVAQAAAGVGVALAGIGAAVIKLGERGAAVADVEAAFRNLAGAVGSTGDAMLGALSRGVQGTLTDFDLMKTANKALGAGLLKSADDAETLAEGARLLAKRTGVETPQAFDSLITAMASGRTAQLKQLGLFVDNKQAVEDFAKATGKSVSDMNDADRAAALQAATLKVLRDELQRNGPIAADFGEIIGQAKTAFVNFTDKLAVAISQSPVLLAGMNAVRDALAQAFGGEQSNLVLGVVNGLERAAFIVLELGRGTVTTAQIVTQGWAGIKVAVFSVGVAIAEVVKAVSSFNADIAETAAKVPVLGAGYREAAVEARAAADGVSAFTFGLREQLRDAAIAATGNDAFGRSLANAKLSIDEIQQSMMTAGMSQQQMTMATQGAAGANTAHAASLASVLTNLSQLPPVMFNWKGEMVSTQEASVIWGEIVGGVFAETSAAVDVFGTAVAGVGDVVAQDAQAMQQAFAFFGQTTRAELETTEQEAKRNFELIKASGEKSADELDKIWAKYEEQRRQDSEKTSQFVMTQGEAITTGAEQIFSVLGQKYKAAAIAGAIIATYQAIAKALATAAWPANLVLAAGAAAAGWANVAKIRSSKEGFREGTPDLDFQDFGPSSLAALHGREAVIPQGGGHVLADEIASALRPRQIQTMSDPGMMLALDGIASKLDDLPRAIQRAVRDGMVLAG